VTAPTDPVAPEDGSDLARGLEPGHRFRCDGCGNVTRFDVVATTRTRRFHHFDLGGHGHVEEEEILEQQVASVTCRWCGRDDAVRVETAPGTGPA
jgi:hypothetical protein